MEPSSRIEELERLLKDELRLLAEFERLLKEERHHLERYTPDEMGRISSRRLILKEGIEELEKKRLHVIGELFGEDQASGGGVSLLGVIERFPTMASRLRPIRDRLKQSLERLHKMNRVNLLLVEKTLRHLRASSGFMNLMLGESNRGGRLISKEA